MFLTIKIGLLILWVWTHLREIKWKTPWKKQSVFTMSRHNADPERAGESGAGALMTWGWEKHCTLRKGRAYLLLFLLPLLPFLFFVKQKCIREIPIWISPNQATRNNLKILSRISPNTDEIQIQSSKTGGFHQKNTPNGGEVLYKAFILLQDRILRPQTDLCSQITVLSPCRRYRAH